MSESSYTRRDYAEDDPDSVQSVGVTGEIDRRKVGTTHYEVESEDEEPPGHDSDEAAVEGYCGGSRDTREATDKADELAAKFEGYQ